MNTVSRGIRNAFRNSVRSFSIVVILGLSIGLALAMLVARASVIQKIDEVKKSVGTTINISPAGSRGAQGGGEPLTNEQIAKVAQIPHITKVRSALNDRLTAEETNLKSAIEPGSLGNRRANNSGVGFSVEDGGGAGNNSRRNSTRINRTFTLPVDVTGIDDLSDATVYGGNSVTYKSGQAFDPKTGDLVAVLGTALAAKNNMQLNSTFTAYGKTFKVVGIFDAGNTFANASLLMPLKAVQTVSGQTNNVTNVTATVDTLDNVSAAAKAVTSTLGAAADVTSTQDIATQAVAPLESVKSVATFSLLGALAAGSVIILLTMVMVVRERRREIGVYKAIGASDLKIMLQFMSEAVTLTLVGMVVGVVIGGAAASPLTNLLVTNSNASSSQSAQNNNGTGGQNDNRGNGGGGRQRLRGNLRDVRRNTVRSARSVQASVGISILLYGILAAFGIALVGSAIPALLISKVRPAEVMRAE